METKTRPQGGFFIFGILGKWPELAFQSGIVYPKIGNIAIAELNPEFEIIFNLRVPCTKFFPLCMNNPHYYLGLLYPVRGKVSDQNDISTRRANMVLTLLVSGA